MVKRIKQMPDKYYLILEPEMVNVCFWYLPTRVRNMPHTAERIKILGEVRVTRVEDILYKYKQHLIKQLFLRMFAYLQTKDVACVFRFARFWRGAWCNLVHWWSVISRTTDVQTSSGILSPVSPWQKPMSIFSWLRWIDWVMTCKKNLSTLIVQYCSN